MNSSTGKWITLPGALLGLVTLLLPWVEISCGPVRIPLEGYRFAMGTVGEAVKKSMEDMAKAMQPPAQPQAPGQPGQEQPKLTLTPQAPPSRTFGTGQAGQAGEVPFGNQPDPLVLAWGGLLLLAAILVLPGAAATARLALACSILGFLALVGFLVTLQQKVSKDLSQAGGFVSFDWVWGFWLAAVLSLVAVVGAIVAVRESG